MRVVWRALHVVGRSMLGMYIGRVMHVVGRATRSAKPRAVQERRAEERERLYRYAVRRCTL